MRLPGVALALVLLAAAPAAARGKPARRPPAAPAAAPELPRPRPAAVDAKPDPKPAPKPAKAKAKVYTFTGLDVEGKLKTPQLLYFFDRVKLELDTTAQPRRSFIKELEATSSDKGL